MPDSFSVRVPDIGEFEDVDVVEVLVAEGDRVDAEQSLIVIESDKASMDVPAPRAGVVASLRVAVGDQVSEGDEILVLELETGDAAEEDGEADENEEEQAAAPARTGDEAPQPAADRDAEPRAAREAESEEEDGAEAAEAAGGDDDEPQADRAPRDAQTRPAAGGAARAAGTPQRAGLVVLGAGPGGYTAAFRAADLGLDVTLVDPRPALGGVCLNVGCIPSKALLHVAEVMEAADALGAAGVAFGPPRLDLEKLRAYKDDAVAKLTGGLERLAKQRGVTVIRGTGRFLGAHALEVESEEGRRRVAFDQAIVATGSRPVALPGLPDDPRIMDSTAALELPEVPGRLLVVGGGIIGLEMATMYAALGARVTIVELLDRLMAGADRDLVRPLARRLKARTDAIHLRTKLAGVEAKEDGLHVRLEGEAEGRDEVFDRILVAVGRRPNTEALGADAAGFRVDERGFVTVDPRMRTTVPHLFAIGDVTGEPLLAHRATHQGKAAAEVAAGMKSAFDARTVPSVAYTDPEVAWTGLGEEQARERGIPVTKGSFPWAASGRAIGMGRTEGVTKLLFDAGDGRLLGGGAVGPHAGELIAEITLALEMGADAHDLGLTIHPHPTLSETVAFAAEAAAGTITDLLPPQRGRKDAKKDGG
jgi:dihydrolipoamide dehydrogenase